MRTYSRARVNGHSISERAASHEMGKDSARRRRSPSSRMHLLGEDAQTKSNAAYAVGRLVEEGGDTRTSLKAYPAIMQNPESLLHIEEGRCMDNAPTADNLRQYTTPPSDPRKLTEREGRLSELTLAAPLRAGDNSINNSLRRSCSSRGYFRSRIHATGMTQKHQREPIQLSGSTTSSSSLRNRSIVP